MLSIMCRVALILINIAVSIKVTINLYYNIGDCPGLWGTVLFIAILFIGLNLISIIDDYKRGIEIEWTIKKSSDHF